MTDKKFKKEKKEKQELRSNRINLRLNDEELALFNNRKGTQNISDFIRSCVLKGEVRTIIVDQEKTIIRNKLSILRTELGRIGNNLNQITKLIHIEQRRGTASSKILAVETHILELQEALERHKKVLSNLSEFS